MENIVLRHKYLTMFLSAVKYLLYNLKYILACFKYSAGRYYVGKINY